jgi:hypothetical protein
MTIEYENALRDCLRDCAALLMAHREGKLRYEHEGQVRTAIRDADLLLGREDCPAYDYKKGS